jgi:hypothetical protein
MPRLPLKRLKTKKRIISVRTLKTWDKTAGNFKKGLASAPIDLSAFTKA